MPKRGAKAPRRGLPAEHDPESLGAWVLRYLEWLRVKNYSERTVDNREKYLRFFCEWAEQRSLIYPQEITKPVLDRYQRSLFYLRKDNGKPLSFRAQHSRLVPIRGYFKWLAKQNVLLYNPASELELPRLEQRLPKHVLTPSEAETILNVPDIREPLGIRDRAILEAFYSTGMRRSELVHLCIYDLDTERGTIKIRQGKGKKDRMVPLGERAGAWIDKYLQASRPELVLEPDDGTLFLTTLGEAFTPSRMTQLVRNYVKAAELGKTGSCHLFRHTMATAMLEGGADVRFIQAMLGHVSLDTTAIYTRVSIKKLQQIHAATHPGATLKPIAKARPVAEEDEGPEATEEALFSSLAAEGTEDEL